MVIVSSPSLAIVMVVIEYGLGVPWDPYITGLVGLWPARL